MKCLINVFYFNYFILKTYLYTFSIVDIDVWRLFDWEKKTRFTVLMKKELWQNSIMKNEQNGKQRYFLNFEKWCIRRFKKSNSWYYLKILKLITNFPFFIPVIFFIFISYFVKFLLIVMFILVERSFSKIIFFAKDIYNTLFLKVNLIIKNQC